MPLVPVWAQDVEAGIGIRRHVERRTYRVEQPVAAVIVRREAICPVVSGGFNLEGKGIAEQGCRGGQAAMLGHK